MLFFPANIDPNWLSHLKNAKEQRYWSALEQFLAEEEKAGKNIFPPKDLIFNAFCQTPMQNVSVVILGQDPYHGAGQAMGLSFSVPYGVKQPPSLRNIFKEIHRDFGHTVPRSGDLTPWARQGVFLLNTVLTVEESKAASHQGAGWEHLTDSIIKTMSQETNHIVFMLWGAYAQKKKSLIDETKHLILESVHPSPLSAHRGFIGCSHFSKANAYLKMHGKPEIDWKIP